MFAGSFVALVTPMESDGSLALDAFDGLLDWHVESGTNGIVIAGTTGESATLTIEETRTLVERAVKRINGRIPVIAGSGTNSTAATIQRSRQMAEAGADACLIVTPYYNKPTQEGLYRHYQAIEAKCPAPILLYNVPGRTCCDMQPETVARLAELKGIAGVKEATAGDQRAREIRALCGADFTILSGDDQTAPPSPAACRIRHQRHRHRRHDRRVGDADHRGDPHTGRTGGQAHQWQDSGDRRFRHELDCRDDPAQPADGRGGRGCLPDRDSLL